MTPILVFTLSDNEQEYVLNAGATDYIKKPFPMREEDDANKTVVGVN